MTVAAIAGPSAYRGMIDATLQNAKAYRQKAEARAQYVSTSIERDESRIRNAFPPPPGGFSTAYKGTPLYNRIDFSV